MYIRLVSQNQSKAINVIKAFRLLFALSQYLSGSLATGYLIDMNVTTSSFNGAYIWLKMVN